MRVVVPLVIAVEPMIRLAAEGAAHVPSPRQNVDDDADVPELRLPTGRLPLTPVASATCAHAGLLDVPVLDRYRVALAFLASDDIAFVAYPYSTSPCAIVGYVALLTVVIVVPVTAVSRP